MRIYKVKLYEHTLRLLQYSNLHLNTYWSNLHVTWTLPQLWWMLLNHSTLVLSINTFVFGNVSSVNNVIIFAFQRNVHPLRYLLHSIVLEKIQSLVRCLFHRLVPENLWSADITRRSTLHLRWKNKYIVCLGIMRINLPLDLYLW